MNLELLKPLDDIEWRISRVGFSGEKKDKLWATCLAYPTARAVQDRLDDVVGANNWQTRYEFVQNGWLCHLSIWDDDKKQWITKVDGAEPTKVESFKGGLSDAQKRAAVQWGIGRYLYHLTENFVTIVQKGTTGARYQSGGKLKDGTPYPSFYWVPPELPDWAQPEHKKDPHDTAGEQVDKQIEQEREEPKEVAGFEVVGKTAASITTEDIEKNCPSCGKEGMISQYAKPPGSEWYCNKKRGGCGSKWERTHLG